MRSVEFKELVQSGQIVFKNGSAIVCVLVVKRKLDSEGNEKITGYEVLRVDSYELDGIPTETPEGKRKRQKEEADKQQLIDNMAERQRINWLLILQGWAMLWVVIGHAGPSPTLDDFPVYALALHKFAYSFHMQ